MFAMAFKSLSRFTLAFAACMGLCVPWCMAWAQNVEQRAEIGEKGNLRNGPGQNERILAVLHPGERVQVLQQDGVWTQIRRAAERRTPAHEGWIGTKLLRLNGAPLPMASAPASVPVAIAPVSEPVAAAPVPEPVTAAPKLEPEVAATPQFSAIAPLAEQEATATAPEPETVTSAPPSKDPAPVPKLLAVALAPEPITKTPPPQPIAAASPPKLVAAATTPEPAAAATTPPPERYLVQVLVTSVPLYTSPDAAAPMLARVEQGAQLEADAKRGDWYHVKRADGDEGWVLNAPADGGTTLAVRPFPADRRIAYEAKALDPRAPESLISEKTAEAQSAPEEAGIERRRPTGTPIEQRLPVIDPSQVAPPSPLLPREDLPVRDRWRLMKSLGLLPYEPLDPYNPNVVKGDLPVLEHLLGEEWFFNMSAISDSLLESRKLPTPVGAQSSLNPGANGTFGRGRSTVFAETAIVSLALIKGNTTFKPPEYEFRFVPVFNFNRVMTQEVRAVNINPAFGTDRNDNFVGVQELFVDKHLRNVSPRYDFDSLRVGIQPFTADFRGFLFLDQPFGVRLFGNRDNNLWQYNAAWFRRLEKDTNSGLNDVGKRLRADDVFVFNLYRQDSLVPGFTTQGIVLYNRNREGDRPDLYNANGFLERPAVFGTGRGHNYDVTYLGLNGDGHFGRWNLTASAYYAVGTDDRGMISGQKERIGAYFGAAELSRDFSWVRLRASALYASGDKDPYDSKAGGFDAVLENPQFAGADTSYWIRQSIPLIGGGGTALSIRNGVLASLRSSREFGQSNFTNPGLHLLGVGADFDVSPRMRVISNVNYLEFDNLSTLAVLRNQQLHSTRIGTDVSVGLQYRPHFTQNIVLNASIAALLPGKGLRELYGNAVDGTQYSALINLLLTF